MSFIHRRPASGGVRPVIGAVASILVLLVVLALPASAHEGSTRLSDASASPRTGTPATTIRFAVTYRNHDDVPPEYVRVVVHGVAHDMEGEGTNWKRGVVYHYATKLEAGVYEIAFEAADTEGSRDRDGAGIVRIRASSTPEPTTEPTADPTLEPTPTADVTPDPKPEPTPDATSTPVKTPAPQPRATPRPGAGGGSGGSGGGGGNDGGSGGNGGTPGDDPGGMTTGGSVDASPGDGPAAGSGDDPGAGSGDSMDGGRGAAGGAVDPAAGDDGWGALANALETVGLGPDAPFLSLTPTLVGTTGAVTMAMAFAIFGKKRRDEEQPAPDEVLRSQAARGTGVASSGELVRGGVAGSATLLHAVVRNPAVPAPVDAESTMPRWRRPSLIEARKADPTRTIADTHHLSFDDSRVEPAQGYVRRLIRYRVVRLLDAPDELRSADIGQLDQGDEVQLIEKWGAYWLVLCPDGRQGWLHKMTLGDVVDATPSPTAAEAMGGSEIDADVLAAFMAARARA